MGVLADALWVVCATFEGAPLVYSGQEEPLRRRLEFFEKDDIGFSAFAKTGFFETFLKLKKRNRALHNGLAGGRATRVELDDASGSILAYERVKGSDRVVVFVNLSATAAAEYTLPETFDVRRLRDVESGSALGPGAVTLAPGAYLVYATD